MLFHINSRKEELKLWDRDPERDVRERKKRKSASERERERYGAMAIPPEL